MTWIVGNNQPGYMPVGEPHEVDTWDEAWECLKSDLTEWADFDDGLYADDEEISGTLAMVEGWIKDEEPYVTARLAGQEVEVSFSGNDDWPMAFWIMETGDKA